MARRASQTSRTGAEIRRLKGHKDNVNAVAFLPDGTLATAGYDATLRLWPADGSAPRVIEFDTPLNSVIALPGGRLAAGGADGSVRFVRPDGAPAGRVEAAAAPVIALAVSPDGGTARCRQPARRGRPDRRRRACACARR